MLARVSGVEGCKIRWTLSAYRKFVFLALRIKIVWPSDLLFVNLSKHTGLTRILKDVPPYMLVEGDPLRLVTINRVGLKRAGVPPEVQDQLRRAHRLLARSGLDVSHALERIEQELGDGAEVRHLVAFIRESQARGMGIGR